MYKMTDHAVAQLHKRYSPDVGKKEIENALKNKENIKYIQRISDTRSLIYLHTSNGIVKAIYHRKAKKIITVLTWVGNYKVDLFASVPLDNEEENKLFKVTIFPDCYKETGCDRALTKMFMVHPDGAKEPMGFNHYLFDTVFYYVWDSYNTLLNMGNDSNEDPKEIYQKEQKALREIKTCIIEDQNGKTYNLFQQCEETTDETASA